MTHIC